MINLTRTLNLEDNMWALNIAYCSTARKLD